MDRFFDLKDISENCLVFRSLSISAVRMTIAAAATDVDTDERRVGRREEGQGF